MGEEITMFIGRKSDGTIYGAWTCQQPQDADHTGMEEVPDDHPEVLAFIIRPMLRAKDIVDQIIDLDPVRKATLKAELVKP